MNTQVVLITGALTGIGRAAAVIFAKEGAHVVVSGRRDKEGQELAAELNALGAEAIFVHTDVRNDDDVRDLVDRTVARFGRLDAAINCAGTEGKHGPVTEQTAETYAATFDTNVLGTEVRKVASSHAAMVSHPKEVADLITLAANAVASA
jgi:NAD(P)-dependent dehydrogenase (short-subunit alcohol dehydrogenase family)